MKANFHIEIDDDVTYIKINDECIKAIFSDIETLRATTDFLKEILKFYVYSDIDWEDD